MSILILGWPTLNEVGYVVNIASVRRSERHTSLLGKNRTDTAGQMASFIQVTAGQPALPLAMCIFLLF